MRNSNGKYDSLTTNCTGCVGPAAKLRTRHWIYSAVTGYQPAFVNFESTYDDV
jgi:hypothetical protein